MLEFCELFVSLQGEGRAMGRPCTFVRLAGCDLRCAYCDTAYAREGGTERSVEEIVAAVGREGLDLVEVTGGEPLRQRETPRLLAALIAAGHEVLLETSGSCSVAGLPPEVHVICDFKTPGSGMAERNLDENLDLLLDGAELKIVCMDRADYLWARERIRSDRRFRRLDVLLQAAAGWLDPATLAGWIVEDRLPVRLGMQLHKILWPGEDRGR